MRVLVTGARGKVGRAAVAELAAAGHDVLCTDLGAPTYERAEPDMPPYVRADLTDAGAAFQLVRGMDAVLHCAAIPEPTQDIAHAVFANNLLAAFNVIEACVRFGVSRLVNLSSETVPGMIFAERPFEPSYFPIDEEHPVQPQDPYALGKLFGEQLCTAATQRSDLCCVSIRPTWVQDAGSYARNLGPMVAAAFAGAPEPTVNGWSYIDAYDLAIALRLAVESDLPGHEVFYICSPDAAGVSDTVAALRAQYGDRVQYRDFARPDASGTSAAKAQRMLGWQPTRGWRDYLTEDGQPLPGQQRDQ
ncbi:MAG TPA: NAD(P)-dependent oxidoreductase [Jatrophihabitans sp.]|jgi:nucleoside-diphosphate-sugar epimerase|uniref:NAD-dependent epimerase/dehydratase family protein n=1 Tax=Jatrophihabitans sp. TaxID=1932789 RepID=UPI002EE7F6E6